ncbi:hypothetical protein J4223_03440 [Candidatus Woesearchaeota archaeon]|nr:hypothetical protein [Candidatus Woesearchaeota archaeon]
MYIRYDTESNAVNCARRIADKFKRLKFSVNDTERDCLDGIVYSVIGNYGIIPISFKVGIESVTRNKRVGYDVLIKIGDGNVNLEERLSLANKIFRDDRRQTFEINSKLYGVDSACKMDEDGVQLVIMY